MFFLHLLERLCLLCIIIVVRSFFRDKTISGTKSVRKKERKKDIVPVSAPLEKAKKYTFSFSFFCEQ